MLQAGILSAIHGTQQNRERTVSVRPVPAAWMESTAARRSRLFWKSFTSACRALVFTLPSMRMYFVFVLHVSAHFLTRWSRTDGEGRPSNLVDPARNSRKRR